MLPKRGFILRPFGNSIDEMAEGTTGILKALALFFAAGVAGVAGTVALILCLCYHTYRKTARLSGEGLPPVGLPFVH